MAKEKTKKTGSHPAKKESQVKSSKDGKDKKEDKEIEDGKKTKKNISNTKETEVKDQKKLQTKDKKGKKETKKDIPKSKVAKKKKKQAKRHVPKGHAYVKSTYNNTLVTITDLDGNMISWSSAGSTGFKGARRGTPYAATVAAKDAIEKAKEFGLNEVDVFVKGIGSGRESAVRAIHSNGVEVLSIRDVTPIPHGGPRPKKVRRV